MTVDAVPANLVAEKVMRPFLLAACAIACAMSAPAQAAHAFDAIGLLPSASGTVQHRSTGATATPAQNRAVRLAPNSAVPEPAIWAMIIIGFGLTGGALRRRRAKAPKFPTC
jgi:PEP-CTERM motif